MPKFVVTFSVGRSYYIEIVEAPSYPQLKDLLSRRNRLCEHEQCINIVSLSDWLARETKYETLKVSVEKMEEAARIKESNQLTTQEKIYQLYAGLRQYEQSEVISSLSDWYKEWYPHQIKT